jgi:aryl sulfotransferase
MSNNKIILPTLEIKRNHIDSSMWQDFIFRPDDIFIGSYAKSGTTWLQTIIAQLIFNGQENLNVANMSPWIDMSIPSKREKFLLCESQKHRRFLKFHVPYEALIFSLEAKYLYIARDGRDVLWSLWNHHAKANDIYFNEINNPEILVGDPFPMMDLSIREYFNRWLEKDGYPYWEFFSNIKSWWDASQKNSNVLLVHYSDLLQNKERVIKDIALFLNFDVNNLNWEKILEHTSFSYMKEHADLFSPLNGNLWEGGGKTFINKGTNNRWRDILNEQDNLKYERLCLERLGLTCSRWLNR